MMCRGHLVNADFSKASTGDDLAGYEMHVLDAGPEVDGDVVSGLVLTLEVRGLDIDISFDLDDTRAFVEACQEILDRYDDAEQA